MAFDIGSFRTEIINKGFLKTNRYVVEFSKPPLLRTTSDYISTDSLSLRCESLQWPGVSFATMDTPPRAGYGATELIPYAPIFDDITLNFVLDEHSHVSKFFWEWTNKVINLQSEGQSKLKEGAFTVGYKNDYCADIKISMYNELGTTEEQKVMTATLYRAFPRMLPSFNLAYVEDEVVRMSVTFSYTDFFIKYHTHEYPPGTEPS
jgi:hypothetical protein